MESLIVMKEEKLMCNLYVAMEDILIIISA